MAPVFQSTDAGSGSEAIASSAVAVAALAPTIMSISKCSSSVLKSCSSWAFLLNCNWLKLPSSLPTATETQSSFSTEASSSLL